MVHIWVLVMAVRSLGLLPVGVGGVRSLLGPGQIRSCCQTFTGV